MKRTSPSISLIQSLQQQCICQISQVLFKQPVMTVDGHTYQKSHIIEWLTKHNTSPKTGLVLESNKVYMNYALKNLIEKIYQEVPKKEREYQERIEQLKQNIKDKDKQIENVNSKISRLLQAIRPLIKDTKVVDFIINDYFQQFSILNQYIIQLQQQQAARMSLQYSQSSQQQKLLTQQYLIMHKQNMSFQKLLNLKKNMIETSSIIDNEKMVDRLIKMLEKQKNIKKNKDCQSINRITIENDVQVQDINVNKLQNMSKRRVNSMDLLFKASEFQFNIRDYVQICGQAQDTVILIKTQHNKIIGGYNHKSFNPTRQLYDQKQIPLQFTLQQVTDQSQTSFLFSLTNNDYFQLMNPNCSIIRSFGLQTPIIIFGYRQLLILDYSDKLGIGCSKNINLNYFNQNYKKNDKETYERFHGGVDQYFKIKQWEVWKVEYYENDRQEEREKMGEEYQITMVKNDKKNNQQEKQKKQKQQKIDKQMDKQKYKMQSSQILIVEKQKQQKIIIKQGSLKKQQQVSVSQIKKPKRKYNKRK